MNSLQGKLLVSSPALVDPNFRKTVVLITHHDEEGAMGLVLSRPSDVRRGRGRAGARRLPGRGDPVFVGGPVQPEAFMALAEFEDVERGGRADLRRHRLHARRGRAGRARRSAACALFAGYAGWGPGQLEAELDEPSWIVVTAEADGSVRRRPGRAVARR